MAISENKWTQLNEQLMVADEESCQAMLKDELKNGKRVQFALRIHSRLNKLRAHRERDDIKAALKTK
jgi:hypothetical protein